MHLSGRWSLSAEDQILPIEHRESDLGGRAHCLRESEVGDPPTQPTEKICIKRIQFTGSHLRRKLHCSHSGG
jgi:hypothetical protein